MILFYCLQALIGIYLLIPFLLMVLNPGLIFFGNHVKRRRGSFAPEKEFDYAAIVTVHQDTRFILPIVDSFLKQNYSNFIVYVIADDCDISDIQIADPRIRVLRPEPVLHAKIKSIQFAVDHFIRDHDVLIVFDSDNLVHPSYLKNLNYYFNKGFRAVQTHMLSKNTDSLYARLDSIGHVYNNFTERESKMNLGLSSSILGLGIALETSLYRQVMYKDGLGGFDKKLQADIVKTIPQIAFAVDAYVYDEKVEDGFTMEKQRTRWIYTYFKYFFVNWSILVAGIKQLNFNRFFFGFSALRPPLFITIGLSILFLLVNLLIAPYMALAWGILISLFIATFFIIVITQSRQRGISNALLFVPVVAFRQFIAFFKIKRAGKRFLKTEHLKVIYIDELLKNEPA
ncbi:MAG: glycosyltransferase [Terrimonas sp.]|nr:glycosyltransferase [Terrimonas sp.]